MRTGHVLFAVSLALPLATHSQQMYRCGNTYSQTPCGQDAKSVTLKVPPACQDEQTKYTSACFDLRMKEMREGGPSASTQPPGARAPRANAESDAELARKVEASRRAEDASKASEARLAKINADAKRDTDVVMAQIDETRRKPAPSKAIVAANLQSCEARIRSVMKDPEAARVTDGTRIGPSPDLTPSQGGIRAVSAYTFKVNGKNGFGAYTGVKLWQCSFQLDERVILDVKELG